MKKHIWITALMSILLITTASSCKNQKASIPHETVDTNEIYLPDDQKQIIDRIKNSLEKISTKSKRAKILYEFFNEHAILARYMSDGRFVIITQPKNSIDFFVAIDPFPKKFEKTVALATFSCEPLPVMSLTNYNGSSFADGIMLAHELSHAEDCVYRGEPNSNPLSPIWLHGELNAHRSIATILSEYTGGKYKNIVLDSSKRRAQILRDSGKRPYSFVMGNPAGDEEAIVQVFGKQDDLTTNFLLTQLSVDANIANIINHFKNDSEAIDQVVLEFLGTFYNRHLQNI